MTESQILYTGKIVNRADAKASGEKRFFTGVACKHVHVDQRHVSNGGCVECRRIIDAKHRRSPEGISYRKKYQETYRAIPEHKAVRDEYNNSPKAKSARDKYQSTPEFRAAVAKYQATPKGKAAKAKYLSTPKAKAGAHIRHSLKRVLNSARYTELGYTKYDLINHLERQFSADMTWGNHGEVWEIDHINPIKWYLANDITDVSIVNALTNLRPLSKVDNRAKSGNRTLLI